MKYALLNNNKIEATKSAKGLCPLCGVELIAKCGEIKIHHWAHKNTSHCDPWWENETEWHRFWKNNFPKDWQEVIHRDPSTGEKHIADVKTDEGWTIEFQHSPIKRVERDSRNAFYSKIVWVVNGTRLERDKIQFENCIKNSSKVMFGDIPIYKINAECESSFIRNWSNSTNSIFFDFQPHSNIQSSLIWFLLPKVSVQFLYLIPFSGTNFIELHQTKGYDELALKIIPTIINFLKKNENNGAQIRYNTQINNRRRW